MNSPRTVVWEEQIDNAGRRSYTIATQPSQPPPSTSFASQKVAKTGISLVEFNADGTLFATKSDRIPSTIWIWSQDLRVAVACLVHHSPVKSIQWHPSRSDLLLLKCGVDKPIVHIWNTSWRSPRILELRLDKIGGKIEACWVFSREREHAKLMVGNPHNYTVITLTTDGEILPAVAAGETANSGPDDRFDEGNSMDLSPIKLAQAGTTIKFPAGCPEDLVQWGGTGDLDDTFQYRRPSKSAT